MSDIFFVEPDLGFIKDVVAFGGADVKKCFQCATCSVACPISPETKPFPRKEMIAASWGMKDRLIGNGDVWLCHNCGDCSTLCPRGANPSEVLSAVRAITISEYAKPRMLAEAVNDPGKLPLLVAIPAVLLVVLGFLLKMVGIDWINLAPQGEHLWQADFISNYLVDIIIVPTFFASVAIFILGLKRFLTDMHSNALLEGKTDKDKIDPLGFFKAFVDIIPTILQHKKFNECGDSRNRSTPHMMILFGFMALFIVTGCFFAAEWVFHIEGPYSQINPIKWLGNVAGVALLVGGFVLAKNRLEKEDQGSSTYGDWFLIGLVFTLGLTGMLTEMLRLGGAHVLSAVVYFLHFISVWCLFAYAPFSKLAHLMYRVIAMTYQEYSERR